ncbi:hypothetical protein SEPCBS119000_002883 [Sporothrix epigloea]|uniref:Uncharacterized protein n=1 Tax=Sporothrix epigloea TaxID=1892477 RepID=A0ABP0DIJ5_9PEZI
MTVAPSTGLLKENLDKTSEVREDGMGEPDSQQQSNNPEPQDIMDNKSNQAGQPHEETGKPAGIHHNAGSDALRRAYAKYNINPTMATTAGHKVNADHEKPQASGSRAENNAENKVDNKETK